MNETGQKKIAMINSMGRVWPLFYNSGYSCAERFKGTVLPGAHGYFVKSYGYPKLLL